MLHFSSYSPAMPPKKKKQVVTWTCMICLEEETDKDSTRSYCDTHRVHDACYYEWEKQNYFNVGCPICDRPAPFSIRDAKQCPGCGILVEKGPGCGRIECRCGKVFNWQSVPTVSLLRNGTILMKKPTAPKASPLPLVPRIRLNLPPPPLTPMPRRNELEMLRLGPHPF